jgi:hypothetical protein
MSCDGRGVPSTSGSEITNFYKVKKRKMPGGRLPNIFRQYVDTSERIPRRQRNDSSGERVTSEPRPDHLHP